MNRESGSKTSSNPASPERRELIKAAGAGVLAATLGNVAFAGSINDAGKKAKPLRWGVVGTGGIASRMTPMMKLADNATPVAVSSRRMATAEAFASEHDLPNAFDSWAKMCEFEGVDAIYVATPTSVREEICIAAANNGKHVLGEKPFASLPSVKRIAAACRSNGVGFMDGTHFVHHPRTARIKSSVSGEIGWPWSIASAFQFNLRNKANIRLNPDLEPYGAIGDAGWYNMKAAAEFSTPGVGIDRAEAFLRRDAETGAVISASGVVMLKDGSTTTFNCGFDSGAGVQDLRITGTKGVIKLDDFVSTRRSSETPGYELIQGWNDSQRVEAASAKPESALMFEDFASMLDDPEWMEASINSTERTQEWLDAVWSSAIKNERV